MKDKKKPRTRFCWECGKQLYGNHHEEVKLPNDDLYVIMHKQCAKEFKKTNSK